MRNLSTEKKAVLITGCSTGIGKACALDLVARGFQVFAGVRQETDARRLEEEAGGGLRAVLLDVTDAHQVHQAAATFEAELGPRGLWGLVNNAGILVSAPLELVSLEQLRRQFEVNVFGALAMTQAVLPLVRRQRGRIVLIGSIAGLASPPYLGPYAASKFALEALADSLRMELRSWGISVSIVEPDNVATPIWEKLADSSGRARANASSEVQALYDEDVAAMARAAAAMDRAGMPVERIVRVVRHALTAKRPKTRYPVGFRTRLAAWAASRIPDWIRDWYMLRELGLPTKRRPPCGTVRS